MEFETNILIHIAFLGFAIAFMVRDVLWLRMLTMVAYTVLVLRLGLATAPGDESLLLWYLAFILINAGHATWLVYERHLLRLTPMEKSLATVAFPALDHSTVKRLCRIGAWRDLETSEQLTWNGRTPDVLAVVLSGEIGVYQQSRCVARIGSGHFVGEMSFITGQPATADTFAEGPVTLLVWEQPALVRRCERDPRLRTALYTAFGPDLVAKIAGSQAPAMATTE